MSFLSLFGGKRSRGRSPTGSQSRERTSISAERQRERSESPGPPQGPPLAPMELFIDHELEGRIMVRDGKLTFRPDFGIAHVYRGNYVLRGQNREQAKRLLGRQSQFRVKAKCRSPQNPYAYERCQLIYIRGIEPLPFSAWRGNKDEWLSHRLELENLNKRPIFNR